MDTENIANAIALAQALAGEVKDPVEITAVLDTKGEPVSARITIPHDKVKTTIIVTPGTSYYAGEIRSGRKAYGFAFTSMADAIDTAVRLHNEAVKTHEERKGRSRWDR